MSPLTALLGETLQNKDGKIATEDALGGKKAIGLYFSAHWCPPCRGFTPKLAEQYAKLTAKLGKPFEVVFVSSDRDEDSFNDYFKEQPWLALPFEARDLKAALSKKYKVSGIPSLVIIDGETGETITTDGRSAVMDDADGASFPWKPPTVWEALGEEFLSKDDSVSIDELKGPGKVIALYFSAHWCGPCQSFTPVFAETYKKVKAAGKPLEVIFCSSDRDTASFASYFGEMPWLAIPHGDKREKVLSRMFEVEGIPALVLLDGETGEVINGAARAAVTADPDGAKFPWHPPPVVDMANGSDGINEEPALCLMAEGVDAATQATLLSHLETLSVATKAAGGEKLLFFISSSEGEGPGGQIRKLTKLGAPGPKAQLILLDIPDSGGYYALEGEVDGASMGAFVAGYKAGTLERKQLG